MYIFTQNSARKSGSPLKELNYMNEKIEQKEYPLERGVKGIDFSNITSGHFVSESGAELETRKGYGYMSIVDRKKNFELSAEVESGILKVRVYTKDRITGERHPDMYASKFVDVALSYFENQGVVIDEFRGIWTAGTDTYDKFMDEYKKTGSLTQAAASNLWEPINRRGLNRISDSDIRVVEYPDPTMNCVYATFRRSEVSKKLAA